MKEITAQEIILQRLARNGLTTSFTQPLDCVHALAGIQSQFQQWAEISIMNRCSADITMQDLAELYSQHHIINLWGQRHTLHMYVKEDWNRVSNLYEPIISNKNYANKRFADDFAYLMAQIANECSKNHLISKATVLAMIEERMQGRYSEEDYFEYTFFALCCLRGIFFGLPEKPYIKTFIGRNRLDIEPWYEDTENATKDLEKSMLRYFQYYGPATLMDFCHWSGLPQSVAKNCLNAVKDKLTTHAYEGREYFTHGDLDSETSNSNVLLLGKFDPLFVSYRHKEWIIPTKLHKQVWRTAGWVEAVIVDGDKAVGTWRHNLKGQKLSLQINEFTKIKATTRKKVLAKAEKLALFWDKTLDSITFA